MEYALELKDVHISYRVMQAFSIKRSLLQLKKSEAKEFEAIKGEFGNEWKDQ